MASAFPAPAWFSLAAATMAFAAGPASAAGDKALGEHLSSECTSCHQTSGRQVGGIPAIIGHPAGQFVALMVAYRDKQRGNHVMQTIAGRLTPEELQALAAYYESLKPSR
ncbi:c-type cytochrome [Bosea sp. (in: a-proteobacteria)]|uniref:c-type cytochrome n=1 Tax=Bosea sp. (in: a-proteobacteria) TaxID=1871050 RepID=UPI002FCB1140